jgi:glycerol-3-phosphate acyltransferase PlsY
MPAFALLAAYLLGSISASYVAGRLAGVDLRQHGSRSLGATNVWRVLGPRYAVPAGLFDIAKGTVAALLLGRAVGDQTLMPLAAGGAAILGHVFPVFLRFKGGKGVATAAGVLLGLAPKAVGMSALVWGVVLAMTGYVSVASMTAAVLFPVAAWLLEPLDAVLLLTGVAVALFVVYTHRANIRRLMDGTEARFGRRRKTA